MNDAAATMIGIASMSGTVIVAVATLGWWLRSQFSDLKDHFSAKIATHEREDIARFEKLELRDMQILTLLDREGHMTRERHTWDLQRGS